MKKILILSVAILAWGCVGCATTVKNFSSDTANISPEKSLVVGEVEFEGFDNAYEQIIVNVKHVESTKKYRIKVDKANFFIKQNPGFLGRSAREKKSLKFFVELPLGEYLITELRFGGWKLKKPHLAFDIKEPGKVVTIGKISLKGKGGNPFWFSDQDANIEIVDNNIELSKAVKEKYQYLKLPSIGSLVYKVPNGK